MSAPNNGSISEQVSLRTWIAVLGTMLGAFMAVLDIQITNSSLKDIQGALGASLDEGSWIATSYLVAEIMVIPLTGWLAQVFSTRRYLLFNAACFVVFSTCCAFAHDLTGMIIFRALQGLTGGTLIPLALNVILTTLPQSKRAIGMALFSVTATFAPSIGPTLGGWLTDNYGWQYIFYLNLLPGLVLLATVFYAIDKQPMKLNLLKEGDWWGIAFMAFGLSSLEIVLEEGNRKDWFGSEMIVQLAVVAAVCLTLFFVREFTAKKPFINLRLLGRWNFGLAGIVNMLLGLGLYGSVYILPLYLSIVQGYSAMQIGEVIMWLGVPQLFFIPVVPWLMKRIDPRLMIGFGVCIFGGSCWINSTLTNLSGMDQMIFANLVRSIGQPLIFVPLSTIATAGIETEQVGSASSLFNVMRNLGGSFGIAAMSTMLTQREQFHSSRIGEAVSIFGMQTQDRINQLVNMFVQKGADLVTAQNQAYAAIDQVVRKEAYVMAFNDCFYFMAIALLASSIAVMLLKKANVEGEAVAH